MARKSAAQRRIDAGVDAAFGHLCDLLTTERMLQLLKTTPLNAIALATMALVHEQESDPDGMTGPVVTPIETLRYALPLLNDHARNAIGLIVCAVLNLQHRTQLDPKPAFRQVKRALNRGRRKSRPVKARGKKRRGR
jgi:hypothetical protein